MAKTPLTIPDEYVKAIIVCNAHLASKATTTHFKKYIYDRRKDSNIFVINIDKMWEKIILAARAFVSIKNPDDIVISSNKTFGRRAVLKFCEETGARPATGRFTPGGFTNQIIKGVKEPLLIIVSDPFTDKQTVQEASYVNTPCIAFVNSDNSFKNIDIAIPINNRSPSSIALGFYLLARAIKYLKGEESFDRDVKSDLEYYFFRDLVELEAMEKKEEIPSEENLYVPAQEPEPVANSSKGGWF
ncbi:40S ribosomal SA [Tubulinosema ratisbonensis]|uniref:Small ribosomal subunit protein uS2 n=1 Tax=Tubulinosema ratisbonensis TaxID=291195 RepID=A0A437AQG6_9MICR|nr:40S ribosomal SA [Tubulinosema ratisbonensis]